MSEIIDNLKPNVMMENASDETKTNNEKESISLNNIPDVILKELIAKFSLDEEVNSDEELLLLFPKIEKAFYHYYDTYIFVKTKNQCNHNDFRIFAKIMFQVSPSLQKYQHVFAQIASQWNEYTKNIPRYGALILCNKGTHVLMVKSIQNYRNSWGFPRGKLELGEDPVKCAVREVYEEIGFDVGKYIKRDLYVENTTGKRVLRLYVIPNIPKDTKFEILSPMEISNWQWFKISQISKNGTTPVKSKSNKMQRIASNMQKVKRKKNPPRDFPSTSRPPIGLNCNFPPVNNFARQNNFPSCNFIPNNGPTGNLPPSNFARNNFRPDVRLMGNVRQNNFRPNFNISQQNFSSRNMQSHFVPPNLIPHNILPHGIRPQLMSRPLLPTPNMLSHTMHPYTRMPPQRCSRNQLNYGQQRKLQRKPPMALL